MKISIVIVLAFLVNLLDVCLSDKHTYGTFRESFHKIHDGVLINSINNEPKSYDIVFKYMSSFFDMVRYVEIDVNSPSTGILHGLASEKNISWAVITYPVTNFYAKIHVNETLRCQATLKIYLEHSKSKLHYENLESTSSVTYVYERKGTASPSKRPFASSSIGKRADCDKLVYFKSRNVTNISRFPSASFEYSGHNITYAEFSFNSPTAMAFLNTSFISGTDFNAIVYDMNTEHFVANLSIYGKDIPLGKGEGVIALL